MLSKMNPNYKIPTDELEHLVDYINDVKPFRTKLTDVICTFTFVEHAYAYVSETCDSVVDFIMDYHLDTEVGYSEERFGYADYGSNIILPTKPNIASGFNEWGFGADHFDGLIQLEDYVPSSPTTIKTRFKEQLIIDTSRTILDGFDLEGVDTDLFDTISLTNLPIFKSARVLVLPDDSDPIADIFGNMAEATYQIKSSDTLVLNDIFDDGEFNDIVSSYTGLIDQVAFDDDVFDRVITDVLSFNDSTFDEDYLGSLFNE